MKVNPSAGYEAYQSYVQSVKNGEPSQAKNEGKAKAAAPNTDKVTLSGEAAARAEINRMNAAAATEVEGAGSPARLEALKEQVDAGVYYVPTDTLASAILGDIE